MRAFLSEGDRFETVERMHSTFEQVALAEARAILAETQPFGREDEHGLIPLRWLDQVVLYESKGPGEGSAVASNAHVALADALRAFVED